MPLSVPRSSKKISWFILLLGLYCILPFFLLAFYTYPQADDYGFAIRDSQSSFWEAQREFYMNWSGRFFGTAVTRISPLICGNIKVYFAYSLILLLAISGTLFLLLNKTLKPALSRLSVIGLASFILSLYFLQLPSPAEALFWLTGWLGYTLPNLLFMILLFCLYNAALATSQKMSWLWVAFAMMSGCLIAGSNEMALVYLMTTLLLILLNVWHTYPSFRKHILLVFSGCLVVSLAVVLAPGNFSRMESHPQAKQPLWSVMYAGALTLISYYRWGGTLLIASLVYVYAFGQRIKQAFQQSKLFHVPLPLLGLYIIGTVFLMHFVFTWSTGERPTPRLENVIYFFIVISWFYALQVLMIKKPSWFLSSHWPKSIKAAALLLFLLTILDLQNNISTAYLDLLSGKAAKYKLALQERTTYLRKSRCEVCEVPALPALPASLYFLDIQPKQNVEQQWVNEEYAGYFGKENILLASPNPAIEDNFTTLSGLLKSSVKK